MGEKRKFTVDQSSISRQQYEGNRDHRVIKVGKEGKWETNDHSYRQKRERKEKDIHSWLLFKRRGGRVYFVGATDSPQRQAREERRRAE